MIQERDNFSTVFNEKGSVKDNKKHGRMVLCIDVGNSTIVMGCVEDDTILFEERVATHTEKTKIEHAMVFKSMIELNGINPEDIEGAIISSVVPPLTNVINAATKMVTGVDPLIVSQDIDTGLPIDMDDPGTVGADLVVGAVAVSHEYGKPAIIIDVGTASTITVVDEKGVYIGGVIMPGVMISQEALVVRTAQLPHVSLDPPPRVVGKNTVDSMRSGAIFGTASTIDGMIERFKEELSLPEDVIIVGTGGLAGVVLPHCRTGIIIDKMLLMKGLKIIYDRNN